MKDEFTVSDEYSRRSAGYWLVAILGVLGVACASEPAAKSGTGGTSGLGGMGGGTVACGSDNPDDLIAEFTDDSGDHPADGRSGGWYVYGDPTPTAAFDPPKNADQTVAYPIDKTTGNPACSGNGALHVKATGFSTWGAAMATDFVPKLMRPAGVMPPKGTYDASKYKGISFWAKAKAPVKFVQVKFLDVFSAAEADPSAIDPSYSACKDGFCGFAIGCSPYIVKLSAPSDDANYPKYVNTQIDTSWKRIDVLFADTKPDKYCTGFDPLMALDVKHLVGFALQVNADFSVNPSVPAANDFDIMIDDVRFIR